MSRSDIRCVVDSYARAAVNAREIGFDGVEVHAAHGYLIDQFFWSELNHREDEYGGDLRGRTRFAVEVSEAIKREAGKDFPLIFRWSQWKQQDYGAKLVRTPEELGAFVRILGDAGVDAFHCSQRRFWEPEFEGSNLNLAGWVKALSGKPAITVGSVGLTKALDTNALHEAPGPASMDELFARLSRDEFDLVAVGRGMLADPAWARKVREGREAELSPFDGDALDRLN